MKYFRCKCGFLKPVIDVDYEMIKSYKSMSIEIKLNRTIPCCENPCFEEVTNNIKGK